jgi:hypothetical protein
MAGPGGGPGGRPGGRRSFLSRLISLLHGSLRLSVESKWIDESNVYKTTIDCIDNLQNKVKTLFKIFMTNF